MKAVLLHGTDADSSSNWLPWLDARLREAGWDTYVPDLPRADEPDLDRYLPLLGNELPFLLDRDTALVGHSSGALAALGLLSKTPEPVSLCVLVAGFTDDLGWDALKPLFREPYDYAMLRGRADRYVLLHSDNDPYVSLNHAAHLAEQLQGELHVEPGQGHFSASTEPPYHDFPKLLTLLEQHRATVN